jgi:phosphonatase-like hydrolase
VIELVVLDMAGTTVDEGGAVYDSLYRTVAAVGDLDRSEVVAWMGANKRDALRGLYIVATGGPPTDDQLDQLSSTFVATLFSTYEQRPPTPIPGVVEAFAALRGAGIKVALSTGFSREVRDTLVASLGWTEGDRLDDTVDAMVCVDDVAAGRPAPYMVYRAMERCGVADVRRVLVGGDTPRDLESGMNAGAGMVVGVATGELGLEILGRYTHTHLLPSVAALPELLIADR